VQARGPAKTRSDDRAEPACLSRRTSGATEAKRMGSRSTACPACSLAGSVPDVLKGILVYFQGSSEIGMRRPVPRNRASSNTMSTHLNALKGAKGGTGHG